MGKTHRFLTEPQIQRRIKNGRGQGVGRDYEPWIYVQDVPSEGRSHRVFSQKTGRIHHLLSDIELAVFFIFEWMPSISDIREQFPLRREDTRVIAREHGLRHSSVGGIDQVMSSDFLLDSKVGPYHQFAVQVKYSEAFGDSNTIEKLEIERRYWQSKGIPWFLITELEIDSVIKQNINWLYASKAEVLVDIDLLQQLPMLQKEFTKFPRTKVVDICKMIDTAYDLEIGKTLRDVRVLTANGFLKFDIYKKFKVLVAEDLVVSAVSDMEGLLHVANQ